MFSVVNHLTKAIVTIYSAVRSTMTAQYSVVYPKRNLKGVPIDVWADAVVNSDKITLTRDNSHITEITHYKDQGGVEHEHLRARCIVRDGSTTHASWIRIDRTRGPRADNATSTTNSPSAIPTSPVDIASTTTIESVIGLFSKTFST